MLDVTRVFLGRRCRPQRRRRALVALLSAVILVLCAPAGAGWAAPGDSADDEGGSLTLREQLEKANRNWLDARTALEGSQKRQGELGAQMQQLQARQDQLLVEVNELADTTYRTGRVGRAAMMLQAGSPDNFVQRATTLQMLARHDDGKIRALRETKDALAAQKNQIDAEVRTQTEQLAAMQKAKSDAEKALARAGGGGSSSGVRALAASATPAPRNADGSWPSESCSVNDPTSSGCITPRTYHAMTEAKKAGFTRFVACWRQQSWGEHPKGRACDFSAQTSGFGGAATGADKDYGNRLAAWFIGNADRLGVLYVIWYRQIWMPSTGWRAYSGSGDPSAEHTNHVHLSEY